MEKKEGGRERLTERERPMERERPREREPARAPLRSTSVKNLLLCLAKVLMAVFSPCSVQLYVQLNVGGGRIEP